MFHRSLPAPATVWATVRGLDPGWAVLAVLAQAASLAAYVAQQRGLLHALGGRMSIVRATDLTFARTAMSVTLPAGGVVSSAFAIRQFQRAGVDAGTAAALVVLTGLQSVAALAGLYLLWFAALAAATTRPSATEQGLVAVMAITVVAGGWLAVRVADGHLGYLLGGHPRRTWQVRVRDTAAAAVHAAASLPARPWALGLAAAAVNWLLDLACLLAVVRACRAETGVLAVVGAYLAIQLVRQVPLTPGGVGLVEAALLTALVAGGASGAAAAAVVLSYRLLSCWLIVLVGLPASFGLRGRQAREHAADPDRLDR